MEKNKKILAEILKNKHSWQQIKIELSKHNIHDTGNGNKTSDAGILFELFVKHYFLTIPEVKDNYKNVWLYNEISQSILDQLKLPGVDHGIDILIRDHEDHFSAVQCKFRNDESSKLSWSKDKIANLIAFGSKVHNLIVFTNACDLDEVSKKGHDHLYFSDISKLLEIDQTGIKNIYNSLVGEQLVVEKVKQPYPHQEAAIKACLENFKTHNRGQLILPCGAGKTLTALWIKEMLGLDANLVLVPSLALLRQIKKDWAKDKTVPYTYLCVCSEGDIDNDAHDSTVTHKYEVGINVTTEQKEIWEFLEQKGNKIVYATYQSLNAIERAIADKEFSFGFVFCDEAHKTAGIGDNLFGLIHDNTKIPALKRLYATATPRIVSNKVKNKLSEFEYAYDMSNPEIFGKEFYRMTFKDAIENGILVDYKIIAIGVNDAGLQKFIAGRRYIDEKFSLDEVANNYALEYVMSKYQASHSLTFHSRIKYAKEFCDRHKILFPEIESFSISGEQTTNKRNKILNEFKELHKSVISNARCLTEGVDVPAIDLVYFCDPKNSKVDIVQAVGRALRKKDGKKIGYVVVPIYHPDRTTVEECIEQGAFKNLVQVIRSLCDHDERLQIEINQLALGKGIRYSRIVNEFDGFIEEEGTIKLIGFEEQLKKALFEQVIEKISDSWEVRYHKLVEYRKVNSEKWPDYNRENPKSEESKLGSFLWVLRDQNRKGTLSDYWIKKMDDIGFNWGGRQETWLKDCQHIYDLLLDKKEISKSIIGKKEYTFIKVYRNRQEKNKLEPYQVEPFKKLNLERFFKKETFEDKIKPVLEWKQLYGELPTNSSNLQLYSWLLRQRENYKKGLLSAEQIKQLEELSFQLDYDSEDENRKKWMKGYNAIKESYLANGAYPTKGKLYTWCQAQRQKRKIDLLEEWKINLLDEINFKWDGKEYTDIQWMRNYNDVKTFKETYGQFPKDHQNPKLYAWLSQKKTAYKKGKLSDERKMLLLEIDFDVTSTGDISGDRKRA